MLLTCNATDVRVEREEYCQHLNSTCGEGEICQLQRRLIWSRRVGFLFVQYDLKKLVGEIQGEG